MPAFVRAVLAFTVLAAAAACTPQVPSTARLTSIERTRAADSSPWRVVSISYDDSGRPERVEIEESGVEVLEDLLSFNDDGQLEEISTTETDGALAFQTVVTYSWDDGRITSVSAAGTGVDDPEGDNIQYTTSSDRDIEYDDQGRMAGSSVTANVHVQQTFTIPILNIDVELTADLDESTDEAFSWDDDGTLASIEATSASTSVSKQDGEETGRTTSTESQGIELAYDDQGRAEELTQTSSRSETDEDGMTTTSSDSLALEMGYTDEGQLEEVSERFEAGAFVDEDDLDIEYDDQGRIERIEDRDGEEWVLEYDDEPAQGVTFRASRLPLLYDIAGRQALGAVGLPTHLGY